MSENETTFCEPSTLADWAALTTAQSYSYGSTAFRRYYRNPALGVNEAREALASWNAAATDHGHASFYGAHHIRVMRAYWLGRLRSARGEV